MLVLIAAVSLAACTKDSKEAGPGALPREGQAGSSPSQTGKPAVKIVPGAPTVLTDLQALYSGSEAAVYQWRKDGLALEGENSPRLSKSGFAKGNRISVIVTADGEQGEASVVIGNSPPAVTSVPFSPAQLHAGVDIAVAPVASDPDGDAVGFHYHWTVNDKEIFEDTPVLNGSLFKRGDKINLIVVPYDQDGDGKSFVSQNLIIPNAPPTIISSPTKFRGGAFAYQVVAEDPDGDPLAYSLASAPPGMSIDAGNGMVTWKIEEKSAGAHAIEIVVQDPGGMKTTQKFSLAIDMPEGGANERR